MSIELYKYDKASGHLFCKHCGNNYLLHKHKEDCKGIKEVAKYLKFRAFIFMCSYQTAWNQHLSLSERSNFNFEDVYNFIKNKK